jgi:UDP:flavonoid glycosyltransferase YjiC (YdhE family)
MSARFLVTCWPFTGHVFSQMSLVLALRERGHEVAFYTGEHARATIEAAGVRVFPFRSVDEARVYSLIEALERGTPGSRPGPRLLRRTLRGWLVETIADQVADLERVMGMWRPDVLVSDLSMWGPFVVLWERDRIPVVLSSTFMGPLIPGPDAPPWGFGLAPSRSGLSGLRNRALTWLTDVAATGLRRRVDTLRAGYGLGPLGESVNAFTGRLPLYLVGNVPELDYGRADLPDTVHYVGVCAWNPPATAEETAWLDAIPTRTPWVHVTESTLRYGDPFLLRAAVRGLAGRPVTVVATTGSRRDPRSLGLGESAANVYVTRWLSHTDLLPRCAVLVTTGGQATIMSALRAGVPLVVVPTTWDKPDNAQRVVQAGVGVRLAPGRCTPQRLRDAVEHVLESSSYRANAQRIAAVLAAAPGPARAAELLETLAIQGGTKVRQR